ncbi:hypothetical protein DXT76_19405 [Halobacillus trueperi]|uniref:Uncharacterized protein n=1 Tax=Halobacillus trueperi TaxID=156205 RepID=A0A3D8VEK7_9BACI|nr:hypothetical protein [Halobacillus trueperi]RDY67689.1 hypothetical protein DXT76_19405 [Halobacillus trueperi]
MTIATEYYVNRFKACIMNRLYSSVSCSLESTYNELKKEIPGEAGQAQEMDNLDAAYTLVHEEICGHPQVPSEV